MTFLCQNTNTSGTFIALLDSTRSIGNLKNGNGILGNGKIAIYVSKDTFWECTNFFCEFH